MHAYSQKSEKNEMMTVQVLVEFSHASERNVFFACLVIGEEHDWNRCVALCATEKCKFSRNNMTTIEKFTALALPPRDTNCVQSESFEHF